MTLTMVDLEPRIEVTINGESQDAWTERLLDARIEKALCQVGRCTLRYRDERFLLSEALPAVGDKVVVNLWQRGTLFEGDVTGFTYEADGGDYPTLTIVAHDRAYKLAMRTASASYAEKTFPAVVSAACDEVGLSASVGSSSETYKSFLRQGNVLAAVDALAHRIGWDWWCEADTFHFKPPPASDPAAAVSASLYGANAAGTQRHLLWFDVRASGMHPGGLTLRTWDRGAQRTEEATETAASIPSVPTAAAFSAFLRGDSSVTAVLPAAGDGTQADAKSQAQAHVARWARDSVTARGEMLVSAAVKPGVVISVTDAGPFGGSYPVTAVEHLLRGDRATTRFTSGPRRPRDLPSLLGESSSVDIGFSSLRTALVSDLNDPEVRGRVKLSYDVLGSAVDSAWARVALPGAGNDRGMVAMPEVGDEVLVGYEFSDPSRPVVIGGLYGGTSAIPSGVVVDGKQKKRILKSFLGHVIELGDGDDPATKFINMQLVGQESAMRLGADASSIKVASGKELKISAGSNASITFGTDGSIAIKATKVTIDASTDVQVKATNDATVEGLNATVKANIKAALVGQAQAELSASGQTTVKGAIVQIN